ncbi:MAG: RagB/SusD family nutrient uptake outer membrane protein [Bacteroidota bacterium]|nr:RagB/SusD family nutrient uptake outer membrane protein [Bacteroidota bacterium]
MTTSFRRRLLLVLGIASLSGTYACKDYLNVQPLSSVDTSYVFNSVSGTSSALTGAYDLLSGDLTYGQRLSAYYPYDSDDIQVSGGTTIDQGRRGIARFLLDANNTELLGPWSALYQGVERANVCIANIPNSPLYTGGTATEQAAMKSMYGQALTLRAQYLLELIRNWGDVPAPFQPAASTTDLNLPNADRDATYEHLLADLDIAAQLVPWRNQALTTDEHITKGAVKALRARIALYRGGFGLRTDGAMRRGSNYLQYYEIARNECADIIASGQHSLNSNFFTLFKNMNELKVDNSEILFEAAMAGSSAASDSKLGYYTGPKIDQASRYGAANPGLNALPTYFYAFDSLDTRRDVTITYYSIGNTNLQTPTTLLGLTDGKFRRDWRTPLLPGAAQYLGYNWPLMRYADVLLMFAEAQNELASPTTAYSGLTPVAALEQVRRRAYRTSSTSIGTTPTDKTGFFNALTNERYLEFGGEGVRKYDLIRWNMLGDRIAATRTNLLALKNDTLTKPSQVYWKQVGEGMQLTSFRRPKPATAPTGFKATPVSWLRSISVVSTTSFAAGFTPGKSELLPIPQVALDNDLNLRQNPKY